MDCLVVQIVRYVDDYQPGWVACEFDDAEGLRHTIVDKVPIVTTKDLRATSQYPQPGLVPCKVLRRWQDALGRELIRINLEPYGINSTEDLSEFIVLPKQISTTEKNS
jgi:hypothetical protein